MKAHWWTRLCRYLTDDPDDTQVLIVATPLLKNELPRRPLTVVLAKRQVVDAPSSATREKVTKLKRRSTNKHKK